MARSNTPELVGRVAMYAGNPKGIIASDLTIRILPIGSVKPSFLAAYLSFLYLSGYWKERSGGASGTMKKITRRQIQELLIPTPSLDLQEEIATNLSRHMEATSQIKNIITEELEMIKKLSAALLRKAFRGEL